MRWKNRPKHGLCHCFGICHNPNSNISYEFGFSSRLLGIVDDVDSVGVVVLV